MFPHQRVMGNIVFGVSHIVVSILCTPTEGEGVQIVFVAIPLVFVSALALSCCFLACMQDFSGTSGIGTKFAWI